ncbi:sex comb on midleg-like protein 4, partial [Saccoglossus kowalevskii]
IPKARRTISVSSSSSSSAASTASTTSSSSTGQPSSPGSATMEPDTSSLPLPPTTVTVFVHSGCVCGPYLSPHKVQQLPAQFGPGAMDRVLKDILQACVDCAVQKKAVLAFLKPNQEKESSGSGE